MDTRDASGIGVNVRRLRRWRGMSLEGLVAATGYSKGYLSKIENGHVPVERRKTITTLAQALRVSVADITGEHFAIDGGGDTDAHAAIPDIRFALLAASLDDAEHPANCSVEGLKADTVQVADLRQACKYPDVGRRLPVLLTDLHAVAVLGDGANRTEALRGLVVASQVTTLFVKNLGNPDLAWIAAERGHEAAVRLGEPLWVAASEFTRIQALIALGAYGRAEALSRKAAQLIHADCDDTRQVLGAILLCAGLCAVTTGAGDGSSEIAEAQALARAGKATNAFWLAFSSVNVDLWRMAIALERGEPDSAAEIAAGIDLASIPIRSRRSSFAIDHARALAAIRGHDTEVVELLRKAEQLAPIRTHSSIWAREIVTEMVLRARRDAGGRELRGLADRMGLLGAL